MEQSQRDIARALTEAARAINVDGTVEDSLDAVVRAAVVSVPGFDQVGVSMAYRNGKIETKAATGPLVWELDSLQYDLAEGPCLSAFTESAVVVAEHLCHDQRWPRYVPAAVEAGVRAQMSLRLHVDREVIGSLNFYATRRDTIDPDARYAAELFAAHAAIALGHAIRESQLSEGMESRKVIGTAIGLVMARYQIDQDRAFQFLVRASSTSNMKVRLVAEEVVRTANEEFRPAARRAEVTRS